MLYPKISIVSVSRSVSLSFPLLAPLLAVLSCAYLWRRLSRTNRIIPETTSNVHQRVQIHEAAFRKKLKSFWMIDKPINYLINCLVLYFVSQWFTHIKVVTINKRNYWYCEGFFIFLIFLSLTDVCKTLFNCFRF